MSPTIREAQNAGAFLLAVCAIFVPYFPAIREHYIIFYYIIICQKTTPCQFPVSPPKKPDDFRRVFSRQKRNSMQSNMIARDGCAAELSVARSTNASKFARSR